MKEKIWEGKIPIDLPLHYTLVADILSKMSLPAKSLDIVIRFNSVDTLIDGIMIYIEALFPSMKYKHTKVLSI